MIHSFKLARKLSEIFKALPKYLMKFIAGVHPLALFD